MVFGRYADMVGRKRVYWLVAVLMIVGALGSALSGSFAVLIGFRFLLGLGVGGDYPVSAVMVSEYANRKDRGKLVGMVFGTQALGLMPVSLLNAVENCPGLLKPVRAAISCRDAPVSHMSRFACSIRRCVTYSCGVCPVARWNTRQK